MQIQTAAYLYIYKVIFLPNLECKKIFGNDNLVYTISATDNQTAKKKAIFYHENYQLDHIRENYQFHQAVRIA
jgi:hypothetical protein